MISVTLTSSHSHTHKHETTIIYNIKVLEFNELTYTALYNWLNTEMSLPSIRALDFDVCTCAVCVYIQACTKGAILQDELKLDNNKSACKAHSTQPELYVSDLNDL